MPTGTPLSRLLVVKSLVAFDVQRANFVLTSFRNDKMDDHSGWRHINEVGPQDGHVDIAVVLIIFHQSLLVVVEIVLFQHARTGNPGKHPMPARLDGLAQLPLRERVRVVKNNVFDADLHRFVDRKCDRPAPRQLINDRRFDSYRGLLIPGLLVQLLHLLRVLEQLSFIQRLAHFELTFFISFFSFIFLLPTILMSVRMGLLCTS